MSRVTQDIEFRYLIPREGTETTLHRSKNERSHCSDTLFPERGRKLIYILSFPYQFSSDTLFPERGRKQLGNCVFIFVSPFRYLIPREGTETFLFSRVILLAILCSDTLFPERGRKRLRPISFLSRLTVQIPYSPRGDGNFSSLSLILEKSCSDTLFPERGRKLLATCYVCTPPCGSDTLFPERGRKRGTTHDR